MHDADEQPGRERSNDTCDTIYCLGTSSPELDRAVSREDIVEAEERDNSKKRSEIECEETDGRGDYDDQIGIYKELSRASMETTSFRAADRYQSKAKRRRAESDMDAEVDPMERRVARHSSQVSREWRKEQR